MRRLLAKIYLLTSNLAKELCVLELSLKAIYSSLYQWLELFQWLPESSCPLFLKSGVTLIWNSCCIEPSSSTVVFLASLSYWNTNLGRWRLESIENLAMSLFANESLVKSTTTDLEDRCKVTSPSVFYRIHLESSSPSSAVRRPWASLLGG